MKKLIRKGKGVTILPEITVSTPRKYFVGYDSNGNPLYTTNYSDSQLALPLPEGKIEKRRKLWLFKNIGSNGQVRPGLHGDAADLAQAAEIGIGTALAPIAVAPVVPGITRLLTNPYVDAALTADGVINAPSRIREGIEDISNRNYGSAAWNLGTTALDLVGGANLARKATSLVKGRRVPKITSENAASITPEQWTAAQDAAIAIDDMAEAQRLSDLHFKTKASKNKLIDENGNPVALKHYGNVWNVFDPDRTMSGTLWTANEDAFKLDDIMSFPASDLPAEWKTLYINMENPIQDDVSMGTTRMLSEIRKGSKDAIKESIRKYGISNPDGVFTRIKITEDFLKKNGYDLNNQEIQEILNNPEFYGKEPTMAATAYPNNIKLADAVTYDDNGDRIPLGERHNFNINDNRYGLLPFIGLGTLGTMYGTSKR